MNPKPDGGMRARHTFAIVLALISGGLLIWIIPHHNGFCVHKFCGKENNKIK